MRKTVPAQSQRIQPATLGDGRRLTNPITGTSNPTKGYPAADPGPLSSPQREERGLSHFHPGSLTSAIRFPSHRNPHLSPSSSEPSRGTFTPPQGAASGRRHERTPPENPHRGTLPGKVKGSPQKDAASREHLKRPTSFPFMTKPSRVPSPARRVTTGGQHRGTTKMNGEGISHWRGPFSRQGRGPL